MYVVGILAQTRFARSLKQMVSSFKGFQPVEVSVVMGAKYIGGVLFLKVNGSIYIICLAGNKAQTRATKALKEVVSPFKGFQAAFLPPLPLF